MPPTPTTPLHTNFSGPSPHQISRPLSRIGRAKQKRSNKEKGNHIKVSFAKTEPTVTAPAAPVAEATGPAAVAPATPPAPQPVATTPAATPAAPVAAEPTPAPVMAPLAPVMTVTDNAGLAVAVVPTGGAVSKPTAFYDDETLEATDLVLPRLTIVQKVGELSTVFPPGSIILNGQLVLAPAGKALEVSPSIRMLVVGFQPTLFVEKVEGGGRGNMFATEAQVVASGGSLDWNEAKASGKRLYQRLATAMVLIEQPAGLDAGSFPNVIAGKNYALGLYSMKGTAYTNGARHFKSARKIGHLKDGYRSGWWTLASQLKKFGENYAYIPVVNSAGASTPELREGLVGLLGF